MRRTLAFLAKKGSFYEGAALRQRYQPAIFFYDKYATHQEIFLCKINISSEEKMLRQQNHKALPTISVHRNKSKVIYTTEVLFIKIIVQFRTPGLTSLEPKLADYMSLS